MNGTWDSGRENPVFKAFFDVPEVWIPEGTEIPQIVKE